MNLPAEHGRYPCRAQPLREREEVIIQIPATAGQWQLVAKSDVGLDRQQAVYCSESRGRRGLGMVQKLAQPDLAQASGDVPADNCKLHFICPGREQSESLMQGADPRINYALRPARICACAGLTVYANSVSGCRQPPRQRSPAAAA